MKKKHVWIGALVGTVAVTAAVTVFGAKKVIRRNCRRQVKSKLKTIPFVTDDFADEQAEAICKV